MNLKLHVRAVPIFEIKTFRLFNYVNVDTVHVLNLYAVYFFWKELKLN